MADSTVKEEKWWQAVTEESLGVLNTSNDQPKVEFTVEFEDAKTLSWASQV